MPGTESMIAGSGSGAVWVPQVALDLGMAKVSKVCPECGHEFKGNGWDGIDAHWRANHAHLMRYEEAWPLINAGTYKSKSEPSREDLNQAAARIVREATEPE